jgi:glycosidase
MKKQWWMETVGYQIYPRSYKDTNGDGIGDLPGIIEKLDYIAQLGVNLIWICPFYKSPMDDNGYDVSDFYNVDELFGTMDDAKELIKQAHDRGIRIILDLVMNQTSDEHPWFVESRSSKDNPKRDWYIWQDGKYDKTGSMLPPNNWASFFEGSCWNFDEHTGQYYMKIFSNKMPDLNWENPKLRIAMADMAKWWLDLGVDGFRVDAIAHLAKDTTFKDSTMNVEPGQYAPDWRKFSNRDHLFDYLAEFHDEVLAHYDCVTVGEVGGGAQVEEAERYAGYRTKGFNMVFNFDHCWKNGAFEDEGRTKGKLTTNVIDLKKTFERWILGSEGKVWMPQYWLNHDHPRVVSQYGDTEEYHRVSAQMLGAVLLTLPGTPFIYNGEEIGMTNVDYESVEEFRDVWVRNFVPSARKRISEEQILTHLRRASRDNARTPMQWDDSENAGFTTGIPHLRTVGNYKTINVKNQQMDENSVLSMYKRLIQFRLNSDLKEVLIYGKFRLIQEDHPDIFAYCRYVDTDEVVIIANFRDTNVTFDFEYVKYELVCSNYENIGSDYLPYEFRVLRAKGV